MKKLLILLLLTFQCFAQSNAFTFNLYSKIGAEEGNLAFSPYGIFSNLSLLYFGANAETATQMKEVLHLGDIGSNFLNSFHQELIRLSQKSQNGYQLHIANALFPQEGVRFLPQFQQIGNEIFEAELETVNYSKPAKATEIINKWISDKTQKKIPQMLREGDLDPSTSLILANAVYFQGQWLYPFVAKTTKQAPFHIPSKPTIEVEMMQQIHSFPYFENEQMQAVFLPFKRENKEQPPLACLILLPRNDLLDVENHLKEENLKSWISSSKQTTLDLQVPKFCIRKRINLNDPLRELGMRSAFSLNADFSKINGATDLFLSKVLHETYFSFQENGVEAASATTSHVAVKSAPMPPEKVTLFVADHPFVFLILDTESKAILFMGRVANPTTEKCDEN